MVSKQKPFTMSEINTVSCKINHEAISLAKKNVSGIHWEVGGGFGVKYYEDSL